MIGEGKQEGGDRRREGEKEYRPFKSSCFGLNRTSCETFAILSTTPVRKHRP